MLTMTAPARTRRPSGDLVARSYTSCPVLSGLLSDSTTVRVVGVVVCSMGICCADCFCRAPSSYDGDDAVVDSGRRAPRS